VIILILLLNTVNTVNTTVNTLEHGIWLRMGANPTISTQPQDSL